MHTFQEYCEHRDEQLTEMGMAGRKWLRPEDIEKFKELVKSKDPPTRRELADELGFGKETVDRLLKRELTPEQRERYRTLTRVKTDLQAAERARKRHASGEMAKYRTPEYRKWLTGMWPGEATRGTVPSEFRNTIARWRKRSASGEWHKSLIGYIQELQGDLEAGRTTIEELIQTLRVRGSELPPEQIEAIRQVLQTSAA